jgi:hypothetical protein
MMVSLATSEFKIKKKIDKKKKTGAVYNFFYKSTT